MKMEVGTIWQIEEEDRDRMEGVSPMRCYRLGGLRGWISAGASSSFSPPYRQHHVPLSRSSRRPIVVVDIFVLDLQPLSTYRLVP